jgi:hypothetical protein
MTDIAAHLTDHVVPFVPVRQFVLSFPYWLRYGLAYDHDRCTAVLKIFMRAVHGYYRRRASACICRGPTVRGDDGKAYSWHGKACSWHGKACPRGATWARTTSAESVQPTPAHGLQPFPQDCVRLVIAKLARADMCQKPTNSNVVVARRALLVEEDQVGGQRALR